MMKFLNIVVLKGDKIQTYMLRLLNCRVDGYSINYC